MSQHYTDKRREKNPYALPDFETFIGEDGKWYAWACFPGCLPDGDPIGPYATERSAIIAWRNQS